MPHRNEDIPRGTKLYQSGIESVWNELLYNGIKSIYK